MASVKKIFFAPIFVCFFLSGAVFAQENPAEIYNNGGFSRAIKIYRAGAKKNNINGYLNLAVIFKDLSRDDFGIGVLNFARAKFGDDPRILGLLGRLYYLNGRHDEAIRVLLRLNRAKPGDLDGLITLGLCYQEKGNDERAQYYFQKTIELNKNNVFAHLSLADLYYRQNKLEESAREYRALSFIDSSLEQIYGCWGDILFKLGNYKEALRVCEKVTFIDPQNKAAREKLDLIHDKIGQAYFDKQKELKKISQERKAVFVVPAPVIKNAVYIRIGLARTAGPINFKCSTGFTVKTENNLLLVARGTAGDTYTLSRSSGNKLLISTGKKENIFVDEPVVIKPSSPEGTVTLFEVKFGKNNFWSNVEDRSYRGEIEAGINGDVIGIVNCLSLEEYLYGVVPSEMYSSWPMEALKAQAVAARSESLAKLGRHKKEGFDLCAEVHCQAYSGVENETELARMAVDSTRGEILEYNSRPVDAIYSANCGGHTQNNIFGRKEERPYFCGVADIDDFGGTAFPLSPFEMEAWIKYPPKDIYCNISGYSSASSFRWVRIYSAAQMRRMVEKICPAGDIRKIIVLKRNDSGHVDKIKIVGTKDSCVLEKELNIRRGLGNLRSSMFKVETKYGPDRLPEQFVFYGGGWGHGVGMCQAGACGMAKTGKNYRQILKHYFGPAYLKKIY